MEATNEQLLKRISDLEVNVGVLQKLIGVIYDAKAEARVAEKTADKALAMAQESLTITMGQQQTAPNHAMTDFEFDPMSVPGVAGTIQGPSLRPRPTLVPEDEERGPTDEELSKVLNEGDESIGVADVPD